MQYVPPPPLRGMTWRRATPILVVSTLVGCQSYEPAPLDMNAYRASLDARLTRTEPIADFARRMHGADDAVPSAFDPSDGISYPEGEVIALFYNPDLRIARLEAGVALATRENAGLWEDPVFGFDGAEILSPPSPFEYGLMLSLTIPISGRLEVEKDRAGAAYEAQLRTIVDAEWRTRSMLRTQWSNWTAALAQAELLTDLIVQMKAMDKLADTLETNGELNRVERRLLRIELANRIAQETDLQIQIDEAAFALLEILGLPPEATDLLVPAFPGTPAPSVTDATTRLIEANTELAVKFAEYRTAEETLRLEIKKQIPDITIGSGYGTEFNDTRVMFGLAIPLPILNANRAAIAEASAIREVARAEAETTFARLSRELAAAERTLAAKRDQRGQYERKIVPLLEQQADDIKKIADLGELDMFVLIETMTRTADAKRRLVEIRLAELHASIVVSRILGPENSATPSPVATSPIPSHLSLEPTDAVVAGGNK